MFIKPISTSLLCVITATLAATSAHGAAVTLTIDSSFEGLALPDHTPLGTGFYEVGWIAAGTTRAQIVDAFNAANLGFIDSVFNTVAAFPFTPGGAESFGPGLVNPPTFTLVPDNDAVALAAYKDPAGGAAGKSMYGWIRNAQPLANTTAMAFVDSPLTFPPANDLLGFTDFAETFATDIASLPAGDVYVGSIADVIMGGGIDINGGSAVDDLGLNGGPNVLQTAIVVPEPSAAVALLAGIGALFLRRNRWS